MLDLLDLETGEIIEEELIAVGCLNLMVDQDFDIEGLYG